MYVHCSRDTISIIDMRTTLLAIWGVGLLSVIVAGCSASGPRQAEQLDPLLRQAGFRVTPADTTARREALSTVEPLKVQYFAYKGHPRFWVADPFVCHCVYAGNEDNYLRLRELKHERAELLDEETAQQKFLEFETLPANQAFYGD
jgi:hypothetical protein